MNEQFIIKEFKKAVSKLYGNRLDKIILYGSRARRDHRDDSDFDFLVVLKDDEINRFEEVKRLNHVVFPITLEHDTDISFKPVTNSLLIQADKPFYREVQREGKVV
ncbi:MAG: nucleotidyltransferase domain-containing protein [Chitinophagales bacterium]